MLSLQYHSAMLACRRTTRLYPQLLKFRTNTTLQSETIQDAVVPPPASKPPPALSPAPRTTTSTEAQEEKAASSDSTTDSKKTKGRVWPTRRPYISLEHPRQYSRPIGVGVLPVYDEAIEYIKRDSKARKEEIKRYQVTLDKAQNESEVDSKEVERLREKIKILEVQSEINLPSVRWKARNGLGEGSSV